ncbi:MAG TPA: hypothetical protein PKD00_03210 [Burkholderiales bacterium]|nr:hypothetical protein [Burkholderiales bacterium]
MIDKKFTQLDNMKFVYYGDIMVFYTEIRADCYLILATATEFNDGSYYISQCGKQIIASDFLSLITKWRKEPIVDSIFMYHGHMSKEQIPEYIKKLYNPFIYKGDITNSFIFNSNSIKIEDVITSFNLVPKEDITIDKNENENNISEFFYEKDEYTKNLWGMIYADRNGDEKLALTYLDKLKKLEDENE